jgi:SRSO17 transposase
LYVPQDWITDPKHRAKAGIPESIDFRTNPQIALEQIRTTSANDLPRGVVLMDAGFGTDISLRDEIGALGLA